MYQQRDQLKLDAESRRPVEVTRQSFQLAGASLSEQQKTELKALNQEAATLSTQFTNRLLAATKAGGPAVSDKAALAGLSEGEIAAAAEAAEARGLKTSGFWRCRTPPSSRNCKVCQTAARAKHCLTLHGTVRKRRRQRYAPTDRTPGGSAGAAGETAGL